MNTEQESRTILPTGFRNIDTSLGYRVYDEKTDELIQTNRGVLSGSKVTLIGKSHTGKSTLGMKIIANMARPWILQGDTRVKIHIIDVEAGLNNERIRMLTGFTIQQMADHVVLHDVSNVEDLKDLVKATIDEKKDRSYKRDEVISHQGGKIKYFPPTFIFVDSITHLMPQEVTDLKKDVKQTLYMQASGEVDRFMKQYNSYFREYNINLFFTAHIGARIEMNAMPGQRLSREWKTLPADIKINAPKSTIYGIDLGIFIKRIEAKDEKAVSEKSAEHLDAKAIMEAVIYKARQPGEGTEFFLVQDKTGFNPLKSFLYECQKNKILESKPGARELKNYGKVPSKKLIETFVSDPKFRQELFAQYDVLKEAGLESNRQPLSEIQANNDIMMLMTD